MDDGLGAVGRELRQGIGAELRADAEETERLVAIAARRRRSLADVANDLLARGDTVAVELPGARFTGTIVHAAGDLLRLHGPAGALDVHLGGPVALTVVERAPTGGIERVDGPASFRSRLLELELDGATVELAHEAAAGTLVGRLLAVAVDHAVVVDPAGNERHLSLRGLSWVRSR